MSSKIHHNTAKKAKKFGVELVQVENEFEARKDGQTLAMHASASVALDKAIAALGGPVVDPVKRVAKATAAIKKMAKPKKFRVKAKRDYSEDELLEGDDEDEPQGNSIIKPKYKTRYKPFKMTNGDDLNKLLAEHLKVKDELGKPRVDAARLKRFAQANGVWAPEYVKLNLGMQRLNIGNRLRGKIRRDKHEVVWAS